MQTWYFAINLHSVHKETPFLIVVQIKSARAGSDIRADRGEWQSEMKARNCALRANIAQFPRFPIRMVRPEVGPYLGLSRLYVEHQSTTISTIFNHTQFSRPLRSSNKQQRRGRRPITHLNKEPSALLLCVRRFSLFKINAKTRNARKKSGAEKIRAASWLLPWFF